MGRYPNIRDHTKHYTLDASSGCHVWVGAKGGPGYGLIRKNSRLMLAHRYVWELLRGPIPVGKILHHTCEMRLCINVDHLMLTTHSEHPGASPDVGRSKTHCPQGHSYDDAIKEPRMLEKSDGNYTVHVARKCRVCRNAYTRQWQARRKASA